MKHKKLLELLNRIASTNEDELITLNKTSNSLGDDYNSVDYFLDTKVSNLIYKNNENSTFSLKDILIS